MLQGGQAAHVQLADMNATPDELCRDSPAVQQSSKKRTASAVSSGGNPDKKRSRVINLMAYSGAAALAEAELQSVSGFARNSLARIGGGSRMHDCAALATQHTTDGSQEEGMDVDGGSDFAEQEAAAALLGMRRTVRVKRRCGDVQLPMRLSDDGVQA